jgi:Tfp pilus assembly protein PilF
LGGYVQLFFGYHETYPILYPLLLIYAWLGICANRGETSLWIPLCVLSLMISLHFTMATLLPSAVLLMADSGDLPTRARQLVRNIWTVIPGVLLFLFLMWVSDFSLTEYRSHTAGEIFLPLLGSPTHSVPYSALSIDHLVAFLNQELLVFMPAICLIPFVEKRFFRSGESTFLLLAGGTACFATFFGFTLIGAFRDWDALSFPALFVVVWASFGLIKCYDKKQIRQISLVVAVTAGVHVVLWILINADSARAVSRFEDGLRHSQLSIRARAYGWETLGSYYASIQDSEQAVRSYREATRADPGNARYPNLLGVALMRAGDYGGALRHFERSVALDDNRYEAILNLGLCLVELRRFDESIEILKQARDICPDLSKISFALGIAYHGKKAYPESISAYERALEIDPSNVDSRLNLAELYGEIGDNRRKHDQLVIVLSINPHPAVSQSIRDWLAWYKARQTTDQSRF